MEMLKFAAGCWVMMAVTGPGYKLRVNLQATLSGTRPSHSHLGSAATTATLREHREQCAAVCKLCLKLLAFWEECWTVMIFEPVSVFTSFLRCPPVAADPGVGRPGYSLTTYLLLAAPSGPSPGCGGMQGYRET